jgi:TnpA family transposase
LHQSAASMRRLPSDARNRQVSTLLNTLARAVFFNRLGEIRDRCFEQQRYRASGLNLLTAAIILWNTVYLDRTITTLNQEGNATDPDRLRFLSPLGWEHIKLTGDYTWARTNKIIPG